MRKAFEGIIEPHGVKQIYFYGAGCHGEKQNDIIKRGVGGFFTAAEIEVNHDLLASARATCGGEAGIACIVGTGSNSCLYDGEKIVDNVDNMGYLLGDEGSGFYIGKLLIRSFFLRDMPSDIEALFIRQYRQSKREILDAIYSPGANVYIASFAKFASEQRDHSFIKGVVRGAFKPLGEDYLLKYEGVRGLPIHFVGSIAYHFRGILEEVLKTYDLRIGKVIQKPIGDLVKYHLSRGGAIL